MYEHRRDRLLPFREFLRRLIRHFGLATAVVGVSLLAGMAGYHWIVGLDGWDSFLNAAMLLGGMGPVYAFKDGEHWAKVFAGLYALYSGMIFLVVAGIVLAPIVHRVMHKFHLEGASQDDGAGEA